ncbi:MAG: hypothetical protein ACLQSR_12355 [Limisphaerales bacterium]
MARCSALNLGREFIGKFTFARFIPGFHHAEHLKSLQHPSVAIGERQRRFIRFDEAAQDFPVIGMRQFPDFRYDFRPVHARNLGLWRGIGKFVSRAKNERIFVSFARPFPQSFARL